MKRIAALLFFVCILTQLLLPSRAIAQDEAGCPLVHTIEPGENLIGIARRYGVTVEALVDANAIADPNRIRAGRTLCIPLPLPPEGEQTQSVESIGSVDIVAEYRRNLPEVAAEWTIAANPLGLRYSFPIAASAPATDTIFRLEDDLLQASASQTPVLWLVRNEAGVTDPVNTPPSYGLVVIGSPEPLLSVQFPISPTRQITDILPISGTSGGCSPQSRQSAVLGRDQTAETQISLELISPDQTFLRFPITEVTYWETSQRLINCDSPVVLALHPISGTEFYEILLLLQRGNGAPGGAEAEAISCEDWKEGNVVDKIIWYFKCSE